MDIIIYYLLCLLARKKIIVNVSYFLGTVVFISLSYNTANKLYKVPTDGQLSGWKYFINNSQLLNDSKFLTNNSQLSNNSFQYEERVEYLRNKCHDKSNPSTSMLHQLVHRSNILQHLGFILRSHSLFYCSVPKVATRTLLTYITYLHIQDELISSFTNNSKPYFNKNSDLLNTEYLSQMFLNSTKKDPLSLLSYVKTTLQSNSSKIDPWAMYQNQVFPYTRLRTLSEPSILASNSFTRAIFVRHPLERLASAYSDKVATLKAEPFSLYDTLRREICRRFSSTYLTASERTFYLNLISERPMNEPCGKVIPTFEHFVEFILTSSAQVDVHWQPYSLLCNVCALKYNFIGKYETIKKDLDLLRTKLGLNSIELNVNNYFSTGKTKENYKLMYSKLSNDLICNLRNFYREDLAYFDYRFEDYFIDYHQINCPNLNYRRFRKFN